MKILDFFMLPFKTILKAFIMLSHMVYIVTDIIFVRIPIYILIGFRVLIFIIARTIHGIGDIFYNGLVKMADRTYKTREAKRLKHEKHIAKNKEKALIKKEKQEAKKAKLEAKHQLQNEKKAKRKKDASEVYVNDKVKLERKSFGEKISSFFKTISPNNLFKHLKEVYKNSSVINYINNKKAIDSEALLINFDSSDAEKSEAKVLYEYIAKDADGKVVKGYFEAFSKVEVHSFLLSEGMTVYQIRTNQWITLFKKGETATKKKIKNKDLIFFLDQLSTYLKAGIPLVEALKILSRQYKDKNYKKIFRTIVYDLTMGDNFSEALEKQGQAFPRLFINMVKTSEMTGELPEVLDDMSEHYSKIDKTRKEMVNALMYPALVFVVAIGVVIFIMLFVIPNFVDIYESMDSSAIPAFTLFIMDLSEFLQKYIIILLIGVVVLIFILIQLYRKIKPFRTGTQWLAMHLPAFGNVIIYNEVTMFTKTLSSLLKHNVPITQSMEILNKMTNNEIYKMLILNTISNILKGDKISDAFRNQWAFPVSAYEMILTGERTGELPEMMEKVAVYYGTLQETSVARIKTFIEPILIVFLTATVGAIVLAIIIPMFNLYSSLQ